MAKGIARHVLPKSISTLAAGTIEGRAAGLHDAFDFAFATFAWAGLALAAIDREMMLKKTKFAVGTFVVA